MSRSNCWRDIADRLKQSSIVEPVDPCKGCKFNSFEGSPRSSAVNDLGLVKTIDGFGQGVVVAVANTADRGFNPGIFEPFGIGDRDIL